MRECVGSNNILFNTNWHNYRTVANWQKYAYAEQKKKKKHFFDADDFWDTVEYIQKLKHGNSLYRHCVWLCLVHIADIVCPTQLIMGQWKCWTAFVFHAHVEIYNSEEKIGNVKLRLLWQIWQTAKKRFRLSAGFILISASI